LQTRVIGTRGRGEEVAFDAGAVGSLDQVGVDEDASETLDAESLDEPHATHVRREVVDLGRPLHRARASLRVRQIERQTLDALHPLVPIGQGLLVDRAKPSEPALTKVADKTAPDEASSTRHH
jgi:hypothetical protein